MTTTILASKGGVRFAATLLLGTMLATGAPTGALAETLTVTDIVPSDAQLYTLSIPTVEVTDGNLTEDEIRELFQIATLDDLSKWASISAKSLKIPEITVTYSIPTGATPTATMEETVTYRDIELTDIVDGVAASTQIGGADVVAGGIASTDGKSGSMNMTFGKMASDRFDIGAMLGFYGLGGGEAAASAEMKEIYENFTFEGGSFSVGSDDSEVVSCTFGSAEAGRFLARPLKTSMADLQAVVTRVQEAQTTTPPGAPNPADIKTLVSFYTDMLTAFSSDPMTFAGFDCSGTDPMTSKTFTIAAGDIDVGAFEPAIYPSLSLSDFGFESDEANLTFGNVTWKPMNLQGPIDALNGAAALDESWFAANWRKLIPAMDGLSISNVSFDMPNPGMPDARTQGTAGLFDITLGKYINGLPSEIAFALDDATLPLPPELAAGPAAAALAARDITQVTSDTHVKLHWDEATNTIVLDEILSDADEFFRIAITGNIGNATPELFGSDEQAAMTAGLGLTVKDLTLDIEDRGFYGMMLAISSAEGGQPLQATRTALSGMVQGMTLAILGSDESSLAAAGELGKFLSGKNSKVSITLTAKDGAGLSLADLSALEKDPTVLAGKVTVTAVASGDPVPELELPAADAAPAADPSLSLEDQKRDLKTPPTAQ